MQNDATSQKPLFQPCHCTLAAPDPTCVEGQQLWAAIYSAASHAQELRDREIPVAEGYQIDASDDVIARDQSYQHHIECQNPGRELLFSMGETLFRIVGDRSKRGYIAAVHCPGYESRTEADLQALASMLVSLAEQATTPYSDPVFGPQEYPPLEVELTQQAKALAAAYFWHHPATPEGTSQGEPRERVTFISLEPTEQGYRAMKALFSQSVEKHQTDIEQLQQIRQWLIEEGPDGNGPHTLVAPYIDMLETMFDRQIEEIKRSKESCQEGVAELERCGY